MNETASIVMAAGRGSRMKMFSGNKTLLPLVPEKSPYEGRQPILVQILENLPPGPKAVVVHHKKQDIICATRHFNITYCEQPVLNGTGGALLAARGFLEAVDCDRCIITMGDVPFVKGSTYAALAGSLDVQSLVVLGFVPEDRRNYGLLDICDGAVCRIIEWKHWKFFSEEKLASLRVCNSGVYAARKKELLSYLSLLASRPQKVQKEIDGRRVEFEEYFLTDIVEYAAADGLRIGCVIAEDPEEMLGVDDEPALKAAQDIYRKKQSPSPSLSHQGEGVERA